MRRIFQGTLLVAATFSLGFSITQAGFGPAQGNGVGTAGPTNSGWDTVLGNKADTNGHNPVIDTGDRLVFSTDAAFVRQGSAGVLGLLDPASLGTSTAFRIYRTTDSATGAPTNADWLEMSWNGTTAVLQTTKSGTGTARPLNITCTGQMTFLANGNNIVAEGARIDFTDTVHTILSVNPAFQQSLFLGSTTALQWTNASATSGTVDNIQQRLGAGVMAFMQNTSGGAQEVRIYGMSDSLTAPTNSEYLSLNDTSNVFTVGTNKTGTGTVRTLALQTGGTSALTVDVNQTITTAAAGTLAQAFTTGGLILPICSTGAPSGAASNGNIVVGGDNNLWFRAGGVWVRANSSTTFPLRGPSDSASAPNYSWSTSTGTGVYSPGVNQFGITTNGTSAVTISSIQQSTFNGTITVAPTNNSTQCLILTGGTPSGNNQLITGTQTWNDGNTHNAMTLSITDTSSSAFSTLFVLQGGSGGSTNRFVVDKFGNMTATSADTGATGQAIKAVGAGTNQVAYFCASTANSGFPSGVGGNILLGRPTDGAGLAFAAVTAAGGNAPDIAEYSQGGSGGGFSTVGSRLRLGGDTGVLISNNQSTAAFFAASNARPTAAWYFSGDNVTATATSTGMWGFTAGSDAQAAVSANINFGGAGIVQFGTTAANAAGSWVATGGTLSGTLSLTGTGNVVPTYAGFTTASLGLSPTIKTGRIITQSSTSATVIAAFTPDVSNDRSLEISPEVTVTSTAVGLSMTVSYTNENSQATTQTLAFLNPVGSFVTTLTTAQSYEGVVIRIRVKANTTVTVSTAQTSGTYNAECDVRICK